LQVRLPETDFSVLKKYHEHNIKPVGEVLSS